MRQEINKTRIIFAVLCALGGLTLVGNRLFFLAHTEHKEYLKVAQAQYENPSAILANRGDIFFSDARDGVKSLAATNSRSEGKILRTYPHKSEASHVLGYVGFKGYSRVGQYGAEGFYHDVVQEGNDIVLTIDPEIQTYVETKLAGLLNKWSSSGGTIIVQDPRSGAILAMASSPSFDPNSYNDYNIERYLNPAVQSVFEPGSSFKPFTMAAAIDVGAVTADTVYTDPGEIKIGNYSIFNFDKKSHGIRTMTEVLERSLNTGVIFAQRKTGNDTFLNYVVAFGFGQKTGVDLSGEVSGNISNLYENQPVNYATSAFGQGISVTPIQLINAVSSIANDGKLMKPYVLKEIVRPDGSKEVTKPKIIGNPIKDKTARTLQKMMTDVVDKGFDRAKVEGYDIAGKTGTAQIPDENGSYLGNNEFIHDFVGFAPSYDPKFTILIKMDKPKGINFASNSLSPVFGDLASFLLRYYRVPPTRV